MPSRKVLRFAELAPDDSRQTLVAEEYGRAEAEIYRKGGPAAVAAWKAAKKAAASGAPSAGHSTGSKLVAAAVVALLVLGGIAVVQMHSDPQGATWPARDGGARHAPASSAGGAFSLVSTAVASLSGQRSDNETPQASGGFFSVAVTGAIAPAAAGAHSARSYGSSLAAGLRTVATSLGASAPEPEVERK
jgi:hypothetical protein